MNGKNSDVKRHLLASTATALITITLSIGLTIGNIPNLTIEMLIQKLPTYFIYAVLCMIFVLLAGGVALLIFRFLNSKVVEYFFNSKMQEHNNRRISKYAESNYYFLRQFLFDTIRKNYSVLSIPLTDISNLVSKGITYAIFNLNGNDEKIVKYRFEIVCPERVRQYNAETLEHLLNGVIQRELFAYGICGLAPEYNGVPSILIDRLYYSGSTIILDIVYVNDDISHKYYQKAVKRKEKEIKNCSALKKALNLLKH